MMGNFPQSLLLLLVLFQVLQNQTAVLDSVRVEQSPQFRKEASIKPFLPDWWIGGDDYKGPEFKPSLPLETSEESAEVQELEEVLFLVEQSGGVN